MNRITYVAHFIYYLWIHKSWSSAVWCMDYEEGTWK